MSIRCSSQDDWGWRADTQLKPKKIYTANERCGSDAEVGISRRKVGKRPFASRKKWKITFCQDLILKKSRTNERKRNVCCCVFRENEAKRTRTKNKKSIVMSTMCYVIVAKQPQCYGNEWTNEQRTKSIIIYGKKFCFPTCECCFLAASALPSPSLPLPHCTSINTFRVRFSLSFIFFYISRSAADDGAVVRLRCCSGGRNVSCALCCAADVAAAVANRLCFYWQFRET